MAYVKLLLLVARGVALVVAFGFWSKILGVVGYHVTLVVAFGFLPPNFGRFLGPTNDTLPFYEYRFSGGMPCHLSGCFWLSAPKFW